MRHLQDSTAHSPVVGPKTGLSELCFRSRPVMPRAATPRPVSKRVWFAHLLKMSDSGPLDILTPGQTAALLQVSPRTVEEWRRTKTGPPWRRMGRHVRYLRREVLAWFEDLD